MPTSRFNAPDTHGKLALPDISDEFKSALINLFPGAVGVGAIFVSPSGGDAVGAATATVRRMESEGEVIDLVIVISRYRERGRVS